MSFAVTEEMLIGCLNYCIFRDYGAIFIMHCEIYLFFYNKVASCDLASYD